MLVVRSTRRLRICLMIGALLIALPLLGSSGIASAKAARTLTPAMFGARGDGKADDTVALQRALNALRPGDTLKVRAGRTYRHTDVLTVRVPRTRITGAATLLATNEARSAVVVAADHVVLDGRLTLRMGPTTRRWSTNEQMKLRLTSNTGVVVRDVTIAGSAAAGVFVSRGASNFLIENVRVRDTRADGIHITGGSHDGIVRRPTVLRSGDDGVAVVSYESDTVKPVRRVLVDSPTVSDNLWGRGVSVVGGEDITYRNVKVNRSNAAAIYIASEGAPYYTFAPRRVKVEGAVMTNSNTDPTVDHGAVLVYSARPGHVPTDVSITGVTVRGTRASSSAQIAIIARSGARVRDIDFHRVNIKGGGRAFRTNVDDGYTRTAWTVNDRRIPDER